MKLSAIKREHLLQAADDLDSSADNTWTEYWMYITEKNKEYPFKLIVRKAYEKATKISIDPYFFQSNTGYRKYFEKEFNYPVSFRVRENVPFFSKDDISYFKQVAGKTYRKTDSVNTSTGEQLRKTVYEKTNVWARALNLKQFTIDLDNQWQISGYFKPYTWARLYKDGDQNKKVFFTIGVGTKEEALVIKLDCQRRSYNPEKALKPEQQAVFNRIVEQTNASWYQIDIDELENYNWERLIDDTRRFINHYTPLYDEVIEAIWNIPKSNLLNQPNTLNIKPVPNGLISQLPVRTRKKTGPNSNPDYDRENKKKKELGNAGEQLVIKKEKEFLESIGRSDLAKLVDKVLDWEGYDIISYDQNGDPKLIEVKTTTGTSTRPFVFTINEKQTMTEEADKYHLYRLFNFDMEKNTADYFILKGNFSAQVIEEPTHFNIYLKEI